MSRHKGDPTRTERITCALLLAMSAAVFLVVVLAWWTPAHATRVVPGAQLRDVCANRAGTQTVLDVTTGHRFRVVAVTPRGNVCRPIHRGVR